MWHVILYIFQSEGLKHQGLSQVIIGDKGSAELQVMLGALVAELYARTDDEDRLAVHNLLGEVMALTEQRNVVILSAWRFSACRTASCSRDSRWPHSLRSRCEV